MNKAKALRYEWRWIRYLQRVEKLSARPRYPPWERRWRKAVQREYEGVYRRNP